MPHIGSYSQKHFEIKLTQTVDFCPSPRNLQTFILLVQKPVHGNQTVNLLVKESIYVHAKSRKKHNHLQ